MSNGLLAAAGIGVLVLLGVLAYFLPRRSHDGEEKEEAQGGEATLDAAWECYVRAPGKWSKRDEQAIARLGGVGDEALKKLRESIGDAAQTARPRIRSWRCDRRSWTRPMSS